ncbi:MAG: hypothetical protein OHK93_002662 [Ramalina farinacea]|uniref:Uncharacterized protein n=1 Tax=Ramalina farinacea TaxID=258253 RepID=A0AA43QV45_9LECA|nr:hypothetical protein [Ramalina farinacea]
MVSAHPHAFPRAAGFQVTAAQLKQIDPSTASCPPNLRDCVTADKAATFISDSFTTYSITDAGVAAGIIATIMIESDSFKYAHPAAAPVPGKGTRNMQAPEFNLKYFQSIPALQSHAAEVGQDAEKALDVLTQYGDYDFGSAAWYLKDGGFCGPQVEQGLAAGGQAGWDAYVACIHANPDDGRLALWQKATAALGVKAS